MRDQITALDRRLIKTAREDATCRLLMTCPGGGVVVAASYAAAAGAPTHFPLSGSVDAYLGLMPRRHQFGKIHRNTGVSKRGDKLVRAYLFEAAAALLVRVQRALYWVSPTGSASSAPQWPWPERSARCCAPCGRHASRLRLGRHRATSLLPHENASARDRLIERTQVSPLGRGCGYPGLGLAAGSSGPRVPHGGALSRGACYGGQQGRARREPRSGGGCGERKGGIDEGSRDQTTTQRRGRTTKPFKLSGRPKVQARIPIPVLVFVRPHPMPSQNHWSVGCVTPYLAPSSFGAEFQTQANRLLSRIRIAFSNASSRGVASKRRKSKVTSRLFFIS